jgi:hypothetical protein
VGEAPSGGAGDAPWGGRAAPARSALFGHHRPRSDAFRFAPRTFTHGSPYAARSVGGREGAIAGESIPYEAGPPQPDAAGTASGRRGKAQGNLQAGQPQGPLRSTAEVRGR